MTLDSVINRRHNVTKTFLVHNSTIHANKVGFKLIKGKKLIAFFSSQSKLHDIIIKADRKFVNFHLITLEFSSEWKEIKEKANNSAVIYIHPKLGKKFLFHSEKN